MNRMQDQAFRSHCSIARSLDLLGDKWSLLIMRDALFFERRTYADFANSPEGVPTNILASRLKRLTEIGLLEKVPYQQKPVRYQYVPTAIAGDLKPVLRAIKKFGDDHLSEKF